MTKTFALWLLTAGLVLGAGFAKAQDNSTTQQTTTTTTTTQNDNSATTTSDATHSDVRTITGCLQKIESGNEYALAAQDGSTWELRSDAVDLASHVGQTVTITGAVRNSTAHGMKEDMKREAQEHGMDKGAAEHGHLTVTQLNVMSNHCSQ